MSLKFKHGVEGSDTSQKDTNGDSKSDFESYPTPANVRTVTFVDKAGLEETLFYSDLYSVQLNPEQGTLALLFQHRDVMITGSNLDELNELFKGQEVKKICASNERYECFTDSKFRIDIAKKTREI